MNIKVFKVHNIHKMKPIAIVTSPVEL
jgi:hypothetical protein